MSPPELEEAQLLLRKAREDADAVAKLAIDDPLDRKQALALAEEAVEWAENQVEATAQGETQRVTAKDIAAGIVRVPRASKRLFPVERCRIAIVLRGVDLVDVRWDPRPGPDQERSGVIGIGKQTAAELGEGDVLCITRVDAEVRLD